MNNAKETKHSFDMISCLSALLMTILSGFRLKPINVERLEHDVLRYLISSYENFSLGQIFKFVLIYLGIEYIRRNKAWDKRQTVYLLPSILFGFFAIEGHYFDVSNTIDFFTKGRFYLLECLVMFVSCTLMYFLAFIVVDSLLISHNREKLQAFKLLPNMLLKTYSKHSLLISFSVMLLFYLPVISISYPAILTQDSRTQIAQVYGIDSFIPYVNLIDENVKLFNHHPICHTLLIYGCLILGTSLFNSWNFGIFLYILIQTIIFALSIAYCCSVLIEKFEVNPSIVFIALLFYCLHPKLQLYLIVVTKDTIYCAFFILFLCTIIEIIEDKSTRNTIILSLVSVIGMILFRNDGVYLVVPVLLSMLVFSKNRKLAAVSLISVVSFSFFWNSILLPFAHITPGSKREMLSIPFQQTARYVTEYGSDMTDEEIAAISAILPTEQLAELYTPSISDPVKIKYNEDATSEDLSNYFRIWYKMFKKHPDVYFRATLANKYQIFYPSKVLSTTYTYSTGKKEMQIANKQFAELGANLNYPDQIVTLRNLYQYIRELVSVIPVLNTLSTTYIIILMVIYMGFFELRRGKYRSIPIYILFVMQIAIMIAGPCNGRYFRYTLPIVCSLPLLVINCLDYPGRNVSIKKHLRN